MVLFGATLAEAALECYGCHGSNDLPPDYRPVDATYRNITTGGFVGNHRAHISKETGFSACSRCHSGSLIYDSSHRDGKIKLSANINASPKVARYKNSTSAFLQTSRPVLGECTNVNCHFERNTPTWGGPLLVYPSDCGVCHGAPPSGGDTGAAGSHVKHNGYYSSVSGCQLCHTNHTGFTHATSVGRNLVVAPKSPAGTPQGRYSGALGNYLPSQSKSFGTCLDLYCHSSGTTVASGKGASGASPRWGTTLQSCDGCHGLPPIYANGTSVKANSHGKHLYICSTCHSGTTSDGTTITNKSKHVNQSYNVDPGNGKTFSYSYAADGGTCSTISCHRNAKWGSVLQCDACHDSPPQTPSHLKHFGGTFANAAYGDLRMAQDFSSNGTTYMFNCGNCHPMDKANHLNGQVEVELYNALAPEGTLKQKNTAAASYIPGSTSYTDSRGIAYTNGTCNNVYCHSYNDWTTPGGVAAYDNYSTYWPPNLEITRYFRQVTWNGPALTCSGCHANPPRTSYPANDLGSGDSHSWINVSGGDYDPEYNPYPNGVEERHNVNMGFGPLSCLTCHYETVRTPNIWTMYTSNWQAMWNPSDVPINNYSRHVNGKGSVDFDRTTPIVYDTYYYGTVTMDLTAAQYDQSRMTCANVSCHQNQKLIKWGTPYNGWTNQCSVCHTY
jgi:predicted CxxxxCH...CXXCH cytochrome family protein